MIPLSTTTITIERPTSGLDGAELPTYSTVISRVPAHVSSPSGTTTRNNGAQEVTSASLSCGPGVDLRRQDRVIDENTGDVWYVTFVRKRRGLGLDRTTAGLDFARGST